MNCLYCRNRCVKKGLRADGSQQHRCSVCKKYQKEFYKNKAWHPETEQKITRCLKQSNGIRGTASVAQISPKTVMKRIKMIADKIEKPKIKMGRIYEADELKTYVTSKKNEQWIIYAIDRKTKEVVDFRVGRRNKTNLRNVIDTLLLSNAKKIYTDGLTIYQGLIPKDIHRPVAHNINHIERMNLNVRTHIKRASRRTLCFSKNAAMLFAVMKIYFWG